MGHPKLKKRTKRLTCSRRYKIDKKVREHNRKKRRESRKQRKKGPKVDLVVAPNLCPFKEQAIEELNKAKVQETEKRLENLKLLNDVNIDNAKDKLKELIVDVNERNQVFDSIFKSQTDEDPELKKLEKLESLSLAKEFRKVVAVADVILEVVDARDPLGTRCKIVEQTVLNYPGKRLVIVVNKADLVPRDILESWLTYLRTSWPTVPFKASIQQQNKHLGRKKMLNKNKKYLHKLMTVSSCVGGELLMKILANYRRNQGINTTITVGVVGMPNVGKSSIINSLKRSKSCKVGAEAGVTRNMQTVQVSSSIKILDSPGIVTETPEMQNKSVLALKNVLRADRLQDPTAASRVILERASKEQMKELYRVGDYGTPQEFLFLLAKRLGLLKKRGIPDTFKAARTLVTDWNRGKIRYYTIPPENRDNCQISAEIVSPFTKEFNIENFHPDEDVVLNIIDAVKDSRVLYLNATDEKKQLESGVMDIEESNKDGVVVDTSAVAKKSGKLRWRKKKTTKTDYNCALPAGVLKKKKQAKMKAKKERKLKARSVRKDVMDVS